MLDILCGNKTENGVLLSNNSPHVHYIGFTWALHPVDHLIRSSWSHHGWFREGTVYETQNKFVLFTVCALDNFLNRYAKTFPPHFKFDFGF